MASDVSKIWLSKPHMGGNEQHFIQKAFDSNWIAPVGDNIRNFEAFIELYLMHEVYATVLSSGTAALHLAMIMAGVGPGDTVLVQSLTFSASANPVKYLGAHPIFIDSETRSWNLDPDRIDEAVALSKARYGKPPKAIVPVHLYGMPAEMDAINERARHHGMVVIEDAAEAFGSTYQQRDCGALGEFGVLSFNGNKIITTSSGGALLCRDPIMANRAKYLATQARMPANHYEHEEVGYNYRMSNVLAGIGIGQMEVLAIRVEDRNINHHRYKQIFGGLRERGYHVQFQPEAPGSRSNRWLTTILVDPVQNRGVTVAEINREMERRQIECRPLWKPMHLQPVFRDAERVGGAVSEKLFAEGLCLPSSSNLTEAEWERITEALEDIFSKDRS